MVIYEESQPVLALQVGPIRSSARLLSGARSARTSKGRSVIQRIGSSVSVGTPMAQQRVLGIDPGLNRTGYAVLDQCGRKITLREGGVIRTNPKDSLAERVKEISKGLREVIDEYRPAAMAIEQIFSHIQNPKTAILMAHARGVILLAAADHNLPIEHYTPTRVKRTLTGSGKADKQQVQRAIQMELGLATVLEPNDVADAFAVALCHLFSFRKIAG